MIVSEIGLQKIIPRYGNIAPFVFTYTPRIKKLAPFWLNTFECLDETTDEKINVMAVIVNYTVRLFQGYFLSECKALNRSWVYDFFAQTIYINFGPTYNPLFYTCEYLYSLGFCDTSVIYIDDIPYLPVIQNAPSITQSQDMINYSNLFN